MIHAGLEAWAAWTNAGTAVVFGVLGALLARARQLPVMLPLAGGLVAALIAFGCFCRVTLSSEGFELVLLRGWIFPVRRRRWLLDARLDIYESWEATEPEGLCIEPARWSPEEASGCFGPSAPPVIQARRAETMGVLARLRAEAPRGPSSLRHETLASQSAALALDAATRTGQGRIREVTARGPVQIGALSIPRDSRLRFNADDFVDPRRDDLLVEVEVAAPLPLPSRGQTIQAGAVLRFDREQRLTAVRGGFAPEVEIEGKPVRGDEVVGFDAGGRLDAFTAARATTMGAFSVPAGTRFHRWQGGGPLLPAQWIASLGGPLELPEVTLKAGDGCHFTPDGSRLIAIAPREDLTVAGRRINSGVIPVHSDGRIDLAACRRRGLLG